MDTAIEDQRITVFLDYLFKLIENVVSDYFNLNIKYSYEPAFSSFDIMIMRNNKMVVICLYATHTCKISFKDFDSGHHLRSEIQSFSENESEFIRFLKMTEN